MVASFALSIYGYQLLVFVNWFLVKLNRSMWLATFCRVELFTDMVYLSDLWVCQRSDSNSANLIDEKKVSSSKVR